MPAEGVPDVVVDERRLLEAARAIAAGQGPVAIDAERASGYRYGQRAYLVQIRRQGSGTWLIDPIACPDLAPVAEAIGDAEWVLLAATQDLPCLAEVGLRPARLFDTELGGRLVGLPRVGLAAVVEHYLGLSLAKEHSAVDWSTRPLPEPWLRYAALDVEVLVQVRDAVAADLAAQGKVEWARQEFDALTRFQGPPVRTEPWRRTSGMHRIRSRRGAALVRELWQARDAIAVERDVSPGRVIPDAGLIELATRAPTSPADLGDGPTSRATRRYQRQWIAAVRRALALPESELPLLTLRADGPPPARAWADRDPPRPGPPWRSSPRRTRCRWRTSCPPTRCAGCCGRHPSRPTPRRSRRPCAGSAPARGRWSSRPPSSSRSSRRTPSRSRADPFPGVRADSFALVAGRPVPRVAPGPIRPVPADPIAGSAAHRPRWWQLCYS
jgi:ribonuclease D